MGDERSPLSRSSRLRALIDAVQYAHQVQDVTAVLATGADIINLESGAVDGSEVAVASPQLLSPIRRGETALQIAIRRGRSDIVSALLGAGANVQQGEPSPLVLASGYGDAVIISMLLTANASVNDEPDGSSRALRAACMSTLERDTIRVPSRTHGGSCSESISVLCTAGAAMNRGAPPPLMTACRYGHPAAVSALLAHGATVNQAFSGRTALIEAIDHSGTMVQDGVWGTGHLECVKLLSSYGAHRNFGPEFGAHAGFGPHANTAEKRAEIQMAMLQIIPVTCRSQSSELVAALVAWLVESRHWCTPLHHVTLLDAARARSLLRDGADLHAAAAPDGPTPLSLARKLLWDGEATKEGSTAAAHLVVEAAQPWSLHTHALFPHSARAHAVMVLILGYRIASQFGGAEQQQSRPILDVWLDAVMPLVVVR